jgi:hypothetical protein
MRTMLEKCYPYHLEVQNFGMESVNCFSKKGVELGPLSRSINSELYPGYGGASGSTHTNW